MLMVDRGSMFRNRSGEECFFFDIDVKGGEKSSGESSSNACVLPSMPKGEIVGKYLIDSELVIDGKYNSEDGMSIGSL
jgi:hypothetical protein